MKPVDNKAKSGRLTLSKNTEQSDNSEDEESSSCSDDKGKVISNSFPLIQLTLLNLFVESIEEEEEDDDNEKVEDEEEDDEEGEEEGGGGGGKQRIVIQKQGTPHVDVKTK